MCGICGFVGRGDREDLVAMTDALAHRGPDGQGFHEDGEHGVFLGHRRLAILDIEGGSQPFWNEDGTVCVVFNGEIYNHVELRRELEALGHRFRSDHSDTEVLVHGYEEWRRDLPRRLNGMFAFAAYDRALGEVFLARDRFGEKPLAYTDQSGVFAFASEVTSLARHRNLSLEIDPAMVQKYFVHGFLPAPNAIYRHCRKLPAGCSLSYSVADRSFQIDRYWRFELAPDSTMETRSEASLIEELRHLLFQAVRRRLISDVPLGLFLSGGIDSSAILAAATRVLPAASIQTFTIGFTEPSFDESSHARSVAEAFGCLHREQRLDLDRARDLIPTVLGGLDEPLGDPSILPTHLLSAFTRSHVTVALSGDGGDELFAGYDPFKALTPARLYDRLVPRGLHRGLRRLVDLMPVSPRNMSLDFKLRRTLAGLSYPPSLWNPVWLGPVEPGEMAEIFERPVAMEDLYEEVLSCWSSGKDKTLEEKTLEFYTNFYLTDDILMKVDRATMMNSLESRAIFLDNDLVDFCTRLPMRFKMRNGERKYLLRRAVRGLLPDAVLARPKKGFGIPVTRWLRSLAPPSLSPSVAGMRPDVVAERLGRHASGARDHRLFLWAWFAFAHSVGHNLKSMSA